MTLQFLRNYSLVIDQTDGSSRTITDLKIEFEIIKSTIKYPNTAMITITNPNKDTIAALAEKDARVTLNVGYQNNLAFIFSGDVVNSINTATSIERLSTVYARDGMQDWKTAVFSKTFEQTVSPNEVLDEVIKSFSSLTIASSVELPKSFDNLRGMTLSGATKDVLQKVLDKFNLNWSIQDNQIVIVDESKGFVADSEAVVISPETGMINSPSVTEVGADVKTLLNPKLLPYKVFNITSSNAEVTFGNLLFREVPRTSGEGFYWIREVKFTGNSRQGDWHSEVIGVNLP